MNTPQKQGLGECLSYSWQQWESQRFHIHRANREKKADTCFFFFFCEREVISWYLIFKIKRQLFHFYKHFWKWLVCSNQFKTQFPLRWLIALSPTILRCSSSTATIQWKKQRLDLLTHFPRAEGWMWPSNTQERNLYFAVWQLVMSQIPTF